MKFAKETLREICGYVVGKTIDYDEDGKHIYEIMVNDIEDSSRWSIHYNLTFKYNDKYYQTSYSKGATESQDESPFEYEDDQIECVEVKPVSVSTIKYVSINQKE